jgi:hypothetical protein
MSFWDALLRKRTEDWLFYRFQPGQVPGSPSSEPIAPNEAYANIWLKSARVVNVRRGLKRFYGAVHSYISLTPVAQAEAIEINTVVTPKLLQNVDPRNVDRVISVNRRLLGPVAYSGGDVGLEVGLFSIEEADLVAPYLNMLEKLSDVAGVGFLKAAIPFAAPIREGVNALLNGEGHSLLEIGLSRTFQPLESGYYLVMRVPQSEIDPTALTLQKGDWRVVGADGELVKDFPYLVFEIQGTQEKHDWAKITELKRQYDLIKDAIIRDDLSEANAGHKIFHRLARTSPELIRVDADRLVQLVRLEIDDIMGPARPQALNAAPTVKEFGELSLYG